MVDLVVIFRQLQDIAEQKGMNSSQKILTFFVLARKYLEQRKKI